MKFTETFEPRNLCVHIFRMVVIVPSRTACCRLSRTSLLIEEVMKEPSSATDRGTASCGACFAKMLRCVEKTGSSVACTPEVERFLACERAVFLAAIQRQSQDHTLSSSQHPLNRHSTPIVRKKFSPSQSSSDANSSVEDSSLRDLRASRDSDVSLGTRVSREMTSLFQELQRAATTQMNACKRLKETCTTNNLASQLLARCTGIIVEGSNSVCVVAGAMSRTVARLSHQCKDSLSRFLDRDGNER